VPAWSRATARRRRVSNCSGVPDGLMPTTVVEHTRNVRIISQKIKYRVCRHRAHRARGLPHRDHHRRNREATGSRGEADVGASERVPLTAHGRSLSRVWVSGKFGAGSLQLSDVGERAVAKPRVDIGRRRIADAAVRGYLR
jgi:hypothetical protein